MDDSRAEIFLDGTFLAGEVAHEAADEAVAGAGGVDDFLERIGGGDKQPAPWPVKAEVGVVKIAQAVRELLKIAYFTGLPRLHGLYFCRANR